ncbi:hypothetical protein HLH26_08145 [Gluconacetobacter sp. 1b LMG 1731]|mgnify:FL=1|uniref:Uncharacterized protein n=1 Tax=Gluconacetobacter dulcium TaxID=2729096 RepID=A0A7W4IKH5_9PROT|nr:hypothetical protein [Gluconacetobacter dulcium]MBB2164511.1 hypothetical protein [Gluconacetobacter dulcium]MBB2193722.1 hypothetical protein [Gluconacetobacter dulcium]
MTPSDLEDAIARLKGQNQAHAMLLTAMLVAMPTVQRVEAAAILRRLQKDRAFLDMVPMPLAAEVTAEATSDEIKRLLTNAEIICQGLGR